MGDIASELIGDAERELVVSRRAGDRAILLIEKVELIGGVDVEVFVEVVPGTQLNVVHDLCIAAPVAAKIVTFRVDVAQGRAQTELELVLNDGFNALGFIGDEAIFHRQHIAGFGIHHGGIEAIGIIFSRDAPDFRGFAFAVGGLFVSTVGITVGGGKAKSVEAVVNGRAVAVSVSFQTIAVGIFTLVLESKVQPIGQAKKSVLR